MHYIMDEHDHVVDKSENLREAERIATALQNKTLRPHVIVHDDDLIIDVRDSVVALQNHAV